ncbi:MAG: hypothetical protein LBL01_05405, partial [Bifidobacteriaceae bacterium]|nr:hypothetical protein [Bifidobacteriaceae bacterium]
MNNTPKSLRLSRTAAAAVAAAALVGALAACGQAADRQTAADTASATPPAAEAETPASDAAEVSAPAPRLVVTYEGGVQVLDALTLALVEDIPLDGFNRLNPAGDGRHVFVSTAGGFRVLDTGV